jgi:hypothetical protein
MGNVDDDLIRASEVQAPKVTDEELQARQNARAAAVRRIRRDAMRANGAVGLGSSDLAARLEDRMEKLKRDSFARSKTQK